MAMLDQAMVEKWLSEFVSRLREAFGERLIFVGHHGSWARGEATGESDIDTLVVLDSIHPHDLLTYRALIDVMPNGGRQASGLFNSIAEMRSQPRAGLIQYFYGCKILYGSLGEIVEKPTENDFIEDIRLKAANHLLDARHFLLYPHDLQRKVHALYYPFKECFYALQSWMLIQRGEFIARKADLLNLLTDADDREIVAVVRDWRQSAEERERQPEYYMNLLERWCRRMLARFADCQV